jgi:hypothetical protein
MKGKATPLKWFEFPAEGMGDFPPAGLTFRKKLYSRLFEEKS